MNASMIINLVIDDSGRSARDAGGARIEYSKAACEEALERRIRLGYREEFRIPRSSKQLRLLEGRAWVSFGGLDFTITAGDCLSLPRAKDGAIVSALGGSAALIELD